VASPAVAIHHDVVDNDGGMMEGGRKRERRERRTW